MKKFLFALVLVLSVSFISAGASSLRVDFSVDGCNVDGVSFPTSSCSPDGNYFCKPGSGNNPPTPQNTLTEKKACSFGKNNVGLAQCCPSGYVCDSKGLKCVPRKASCKDLDRNTCALNGCIWTSSGKCIEGRRDFSCSFYTTKEGCDKDLWRLGSLGIGTEVLGSVYLTKYDSADEGFFNSRKNSGCYWDSSKSKCFFRYDVFEDIYGAKPSDSPKGFTCNQEISSGSCVDGSQDIEIVSTVFNEKGGFDKQKGGQVVSDSGCTNKKFTRSCGEKIFQLPFFSAKSFFASVFLIAVYYSSVFLKKKVTKRNNLKV